MAPTRRGPDGLTDLERAICHAVDTGLSDRQAYRAVRPQSKASNLTAERYVWRIRNRPQCVAYLRKHQAISAARHQRHKDRVIEELANIAFADAGELFRWGPDGMTIRDVDDLTPAQRRLVAKLSVTKTAHGGTTRLEIHDKLRALDKLCRLFGLYAPGWHGSAVRSHGPEEAAAALSDVERAQRLAAILRGADAKDG